MADDYSFTLSNEDYTSPTRPSPYSMTDSEQDYNVEAQLSPTESARLRIAKGMTPGKTFTTGMGYELTRMGRGVQQAWNKLMGDQAKVDAIQREVDRDKQIFEQSLASQMNPNAPYAEWGSVAGRTVPAMALPTRGATIPTRALTNVGTAIPYEAVTTPGGPGDRTLAGLSGGTGAGLGSVGSDVVMKGLGGAFGRWKDPIARRAAVESRRYDMRPGVGQLQGYSSRFAEPDDLRRRGQAILYGLESHGRPEADARVLKRAMGTTSDPRTSTSLPKADASQLSAELRTRAEDIWQPFNTAAHSSKIKITPTALHTSLLKIAKHNSKLLGDSAAIPDDAIRMRLQELAQITDPKHLPRISVSEYSKIVSELSNAQHRLSILSGGQTPTYDRAAMARVTDAFASGKADMGSLQVRSPKLYQKWEEALDAYQTEIVPVRGNPVFQVAQDLDPSGRDIYKLAGATSDRTNFEDLQALIREYRQYGLDDAADRLELMDMNDIAARHLAQGTSPGVTGMPTHMPTSSPDMVSLVGGPLSRFGSYRPVQGLYMGDPNFAGPISETARRLGTRLSEQAGEEELIGIEALRDLTGFKGSSDEESLIGGGNIGHINQLGQEGR